MYYTVTETKVSARISNFKVHKHEVGSVIRELIGEYHSLEEAEYAIDKDINYPKVMPPIQYDSKGKKVNFLQIVDERDKPLEYISSDFEEDTI